MGDLWKGLSSTTLARLSQAGLAFLLVLCLAAVLPLDALGRTLLGISGAAIAQYALSHWFATAILREDVIGQGDVDLVLAGLAVPAALAGLALLAAGYPAASAAAALFLAEAAFICQANLFAARGRWGGFGRLFAVRAPAAFLLPLGAAVLTGESAAVLLASSVAVAAALLAGRQTAGARPGDGDPRRIGRAFAAFAPLSLTAVLRQAFDRGDRLAVGALFGAEAAGVYGLAADIVRRSVQVLAGAVQTAMLPRLSAADAAERFAPLWALNAALVGWLAALAALAAVCGLGLLVLIWPGKYPEVTLLLAAVLGVSSLLEALDSVHLSVPLVAARRTRRLPAAYLGALIVFALAAALASAASSLVVLALGVVAANLVACLLVGRMAGALGQRLETRILVPPLLVYGVGVAPIAAGAGATVSLVWGIAAGLFGAACAAAVLRRHVGGAVFRPPVRPPAAEPDAARRPGRARCGAAGDRPRPDWS